MPSAFRMESGGYRLRETSEIVGKASLKKSYSLSNERVAKDAYPETPVENSRGESARVISSIASDGMFAGELGKEQEIAKSGKIL